MTEDFITSINPSNKDQVVGYVSKADTNLAAGAVQAAHQAFQSWSRVPAEVRAGYLFKTAATLRRRKHEISSWVMLEAGKSAAEADGETAEAIDFLEYCGRQAIPLTQRAREAVVPMPGEWNHLDYIPLGVGVVIPPWNFPIAIKHASQLARRRWWRCQWTDGCVDGF
jgi:1-pyrroline-5-carboxylate dehydrogenase